MKARDVMVSPVITVKPSSSVKEVAKTFLERRISAAPVVDDQGKLVGIVSEGDLMHRAEAGTERLVPGGLLEKNSIKRVPIVKNGQLVGIVSRANLIQAVASTRKGLEIPLSDTTIRDKLLAHLKGQTWAHTLLLNVTVNGGVVDLWGITRSDAERKAIRVAAESTPGVSVVNDNLITRPRGGWT